MGGHASPRLVSLVLLGLVLATGFLMGMAWDGTGIPQVAEQPAVPPDEAEPERRTRLVDQLGLAETQRVEVERIIEHYRVQMKALDEEFQEVYRPRRSELIRVTRDSIKAVLNPNQVMLYDSLLEARYGPPRSEVRPSDERGDASDSDSGA
ncbi:MAG: hypothetical protein HKN73_13765 [Gemmatimonadetes bacterium]|nr:hypothetical protein [Gemmatimonadota bacterium]